MQGGCLPVLYRVLLQARQGDTQCCFTAQAPVMLAGSSFRNTFLLCMQEAVKGSQGAGKVDDSLDSTIEGNEPVAEASKPKGPARPAGAKGRKKGRR